jgi:hypothetical protein
MNMTSSKDKHMIRIYGIFTCTFLLLSAGLSPTGAGAAVITVPCSETALIQSITQANIPGPMTLELPAGCVYTMTTVDNTDPVGDNGLPQIMGDITINGHGAVIQRSANAPEFRFFQVNAGAKLQLNNVTLRGGLVIDNKAASKIDGGAMFVKSGVVITNGVQFDSNHAGCGGGVFVDSGTFHAEKTVFRNNNGDS